MAYVFRRNDVSLYIFLLLVGGLCIFWGGRGILMYLWNPVTLKLDGIVIQSEKKISTKASGGATHVTSYFQYKYTYKGKTYQSRTHDYLDGMDGESIGSSRYHHGDRITVYINPDQPKQAIIEKGWSFRHILMLLVGFALFWRLHALLNGSFPSFGNNSSLNK